MSRLFVTCSYVVNGPVVLGPRSPDQEMLHAQSWLVAQKGVSCSPGEAPEVGSTLVSDTQMSGRIGDAPAWVPLDSPQNPVLLCVARLTFGFCLSWEALLAQTPLPGLALEALRLLDEQGVFWAPHHQLSGELTHLLAGPCRICFGTGQWPLQVSCHVTPRGQGDLGPVPRWGREDLG